MCTHNYPTKIQVSKSTKATATLKRADKPQSPTAVHRNNVTLVKTT